MNKFILKYVFEARGTFIKYMRHIDTLCRRYSRFFICPVLNRTISPLSKNGQPSLSFKRLRSFAKPKRGKKAMHASKETEAIETTKEEETVAVEPKEDAEVEHEKPAKQRGKKKADKATENGEPAVKKSKESKTEEKSKLRKESSLTAGMDFTHDCQTKDGRKPNWKIASWNVNGIRAWMDKGGLSYLKDESPDVLCIQETKCATADIPDDVKVDGYHDYWSSAEKAGYAGTAIYSKTKPLNVTYGLGIDKHDDEGRVITAEFDQFYLVTAYVPNAGRGLPRLPYRSKEWDVDFRAFLNDLNKKKPVIMCGDLNVAHQEIDIANPKTNKKNAGFTVEERQGFTDLLAEGYIDSFRVLYPEKEGAYTFWTYMGNARGKNVGWRLDYFVLSERLRDNLCDHVIRKDVMGSDHCPVVLYMAIK
ncbi:exodeoxyribonuclease-like isoform X2 [Dreissena polymorpha]|uniref:exodeoxyribonuclease-like isoform X1 n=1 Tax=Dreissena polymorpha TaxID=45954 RepID=UPI002264F329|nr:exodeoxyribonuclease-like isoform X1 [Dreissena polymorpha]XP_052239361.1 exodeoxyribonuclease-like isoform X2 [Dreissena polymorpha]